MTHSIIFVQKYPRRRRNRRIAAEGGSAGQMVEVALARFLEGSVQQFSGREHRGSPTVAAARGGQGVPEAAKHPKASGPDRLEVAMAAHDDRTTEMVEQGDIFFFFRPKVNEDDPHGIGDVQNFGIVLRPQGGSKVRLLIVGRKRLPDTEPHERHWGVVEAVAKSAKEIEAGLREEHYDTKTRGEREQPAARPAGEGRYAISLEDGQMHFSYALEMPERPGEVQKALRIAPEASFALSIKNPEKGSPANAGLREEDEADYPDSVQEDFRDRRFDREDMELLDYEGAEFVLVGARNDPERAYGLELEAESADYDHADAVRKLRMAKSRHPVTPLFEGRWE